MSVGEDSLQLSPVEPQPVPLEHTGELGASVLQALHEILLAERADLGWILHRETQISPEKSRAETPDETREMRGKVLEALRVKTLKHPKLEPHGRFPIIQLLAKLGTSVPRVLSTLSLIFKGVKTPFLHRGRFPGCAQHPVTPPSPKGKEGSPPSME